MITTDFHENSETIRDVILRVLEHSCGQMSELVLQRNLTRIV